MITSQAELYESIEMLEQASEMIDEAAELIRQAVRNTREEGRANAYIVPSLQSWIEGNRQMVTIESIIRGLNEELEGEPEF